MYTPTTQGKWWLQSVTGLVVMGLNKQRDWDHIGQIIEMELGVELVGGEQCTACQASGNECWVYFEKSAQQMSRPGDTCVCC